MNLFSRRQGYEPVKLMQHEAMDDDLRVGLWNAIEVFFWSKRSRKAPGTAIPSDYFHKQPLKNIIIRLWAYHLKRPRDKMPGYWRDLYWEIREYYFSCRWHKVYDFIEFMANHADDLRSGQAKSFRDHCNKVMDQERSAYRFVGGQIVQMTDEIELAAVEEALKTPYDAVREQIRNAVKKFSEKPKPDHRNCIKESIGAVETAARLAAGDPKGTLGKLLPVLQKKLNLHPAQVEGFRKLYGYTSDDEAGIRHGMMDKDDLTSDDARYMLVSCSAFANYLLRLAERAGLKPGN